MDINESIGCSVKQCKFNAESKEYCTLNKILVGTHEMNPTQAKCTDCNSFELK